MKTALMLIGLVAILAACTADNPMPSAGTGPYDQSDRFLDAQGFPLPGWLYVRDSPGGPSN